MRGFIGIGALAAAAAMQIISAPAYPEERSVSRRYRNRGAAAHPKRHRNRLHVSKRTRRKHRRARKA